MYRFLLSPRWLVGHVIVAGVAVLFVSLGLWQLDRHEERTTRNALVAERMAAPPVSLEEPSETPVEDLSYRRVVVSGRYLSDQEVLVTPRSWRGQSGHHVLTPLALDDGQALLVDRGWVPFEEDRPPVEAAAPPPGEVRVEGLVFPDEPPARFAPAIPEDGALETVSRVDVERLQRQVDRPLRPYYVQAREQSPAAGTLPLATEPIELDAGSHFSYAVQWFLFTAVGLVGYPALIRRTADARHGTTPRTA